MLVLVLVLAVVVLLLLLLQLQLLRWWLLRWGWGGIPYLRDLPAQGSAWVRTQEVMPQGARLQMPGSGTRVCETCAGVAGPWPKQEAVCQLAAGCWFRT